MTGFIHGMAERDGEGGGRGLVVKIGYQRCPLKDGSLPALRASGGGALCLGPCSLL